MVYNKEVQTVEGSFEPQGPTEQELREKIKEELAKEEQLRLEILEAERLEAEAAIPQEVPGKSKNECITFASPRKGCLNPLII